jgi:hypothetical protein
VLQRHRGTNRGPYEPTGNRGTHRDSGEPTGVVRASTATHRHLQGLQGHYRDTAATAGIGIQTHRQGHWSTPMDTVTLKVVQTNLQKCKEQPQGQRASTYRDTEAPTVVKETRRRWQRQSQENRAFTGRWRHQHGHPPGHR